MKIKIIHHPETKQSRLQINGVKGISFIDIFQSDFDSLIKQQQISEVTTAGNLKIYHLH